MKIFGLPHACPAPEYDYSIGWEENEKREEKHKEELKRYLISNGYTGKNTGKVYSSQIADGYARYMIAEASNKFVLIHLPYGDAYSDPDVQYLPKAEILKRISFDDKFYKRVLIKTKKGNFE